MKQFISPFDYAGTIAKALKPDGVLLTAKAGDEVNTMTIGWGTIGIQWGKPIFIAFVRGCRHTKAMLDENPEFTVNIPLGDIDPQILKICGTKSGRDMDKFAALGLTQEAPEVISVPGIKELPLTLECKVVYAQQQVPEAFLTQAYRKFYPENSQNIHDDYHTAYYGEIVSAYIIE